MNWYYYYPNVGQLLKHHWWETPTYSWVRYSGLNVVLFPVVLWKASLDYRRGPVLTMIFMSCCADLKYWIAIFKLSGEWVIHVMMSVLQVPQCTHSAHEIQFHLKMLIFHLWQSCCVRYILRNVFLVWTGLSGASARSHMFHTILAQFNVRLTISDRLMTFS